MNENNNIAEKENSDGKSAKSKIIDKLYEAAMHLKNNYDIDGNKMSESDAYECLTEAINHLVFDSNENIPDKPKADFYIHPIFNQAIDLGENLLHDSGKVIKVESFRILPVPSVWNGEKWFILLNCKRAK